MSRTIRNKKRHFPWKNVLEFSGKYFSGIESVCSGSVGAGVVHFQVFEISAGETAHENLYAVAHVKDVVVVDLVGEVYDI